MGRAELRLGLRLENGIFDFDGDGGGDGGADVGGIVIFAEEFADDFDDGFAEGGLVAAALDGVLAVDETVVFFAVVLGVGEGNLDVVALEVDNRVEGFFAEVFFEKIEEAVFGAETWCR